MSRAPKCKLCGRLYWGVCDHGLGKREPVKPTSKPIVVAPSVAQVQAQKERTFTSLVTESSKGSYVTESTATNRGGKRAGAGRKPKGKRAMSNAERQRAHRERAKA